MLKRNRAGEKGKGNAGDGFLIGGIGNGTVNPVEIIENQALANGRNGFNVTGTRQQLKNNQSGGASAGEDNGDCEYLIAAGNFNSGANKANNVGVTLRIRDAPARREARAPSPRRRPRCRRRRPGCPASPAPRHDLAAPGDTLNGNKASIGPFCHRRRRSCCQLVVTSTKGSGESLRSP